MCKGTPLAVASLMKQLEDAETALLHAEPDAAARLDGIAQGLAQGLAELVFVEPGTLRAEAAARGAVKAEKAAEGLSAAREALRAATAGSGRSAAV